MSHLTLVTTAEPKPESLVPTPVLDGISDSALKFFRQGPVRKLRVGRLPIPQPVAIHAAEAARYTARNWFIGDNCDLGAARAELRELNPAFSIQELEAWQRVYGDLFHPRVLTFEESYVLAQVAAVVTRRLQSRPDIQPESDRRYELRGMPQQLLRRRRPRRRPSGD
jgi:hypothetical protein